MSIQEITTDVMKKTLDADLYDEYCAMMRTTGVTREARKELLEIQKVRSLRKLAECVDDPTSSIRTYPIVS